MVKDGFLRAVPADIDVEIVERADLVRACEVKWSVGFGLDAIVASAAGKGMRLTYLMSALSGSRAAVRVEVPPGDLRVPTVVPLWPQADWLERRVRDLFGVTPVGHPRAARLVRHSHWPKGYFALAPGAVAPDAWPQESVRDMQLTTVKGAGIHEIPVGPIHAGIIEAGHFRFFADGERVVAMEPRLYYVHRGVESLMRGMGVAEGVRLAEVVSGDTAIGHAWAYCQAVERALGIRVDGDAQAARAFALEAERIACHIGDLGAILNDIALSWAHAQCQGLREELLRSYEETFGNRLMRGLVVPGGIARSLTGVSEFLSRVEAIVGVAGPLLAGLAGRADVIARTRTTGRVGREAALERQALGIVARASGVPRDRRASSGPPYQGFEPVVEQGCDVEARFQVRLREIRRSAELMSGFAERAARAAATDPAAALEAADARGGEGIGSVEGWRGECLHYVCVEDGRVASWYPRDPSALNWPLLPQAVAGEVVPDFPLINKSFNLSYAGNDL